MFTYFWPYQKTYVPDCHDQHEIMSKNFKEELKGQNQYKLVNGL